MLAIGLIGPAAVEPLTAILRDGRTSIGLRTEAVSALGVIAGSGTLPTLLDALQDRDGPVRARAAGVLGRTGEPQAVPHLLNVLGDSDRLVRLSAAEALGRLGDSRGVSPLVVALNKWDAFERRTVAEALSRVATQNPTPELSAAVPCLRRLLRARSLAAEHGVYADALARIQQAIGAIQTLPLPAAAPLPARDSLPLPASPPTLSPQELPIPASPATNQSAPPRRWLPRLWRRLQRQQ